MSDWEHIQELFLAAVDLQPEQREYFLRHACRDEESRAEVESLLATDPDSDALIETAISKEANRLFDDQVLLGERLGIYRIIREIGRGGMGSVYLASRDDAEFQKEVALKIVKRGMDTAEVLQRFRYERQILANLEHPYIARLFDGGSTEEGVPFFVMEYVEGRPLDVFSREHAATVKERCELFLRILDAVAYAHRNLVVHRDLKPGNILIMVDGTPKLLDFGVAKLLTGDGEDDHTRTATMRPFTPAYASPEQVRGEAITTATDIYSLGAILYELLSGERAQPISLADTFRH
jgi:serine/threonine protein kinase